LKRSAEPVCEARLPGVVSDEMRRAEPPRCLGDANPLALAKSIGVLGSLGFVAASGARRSSHHRVAHAGLAPDAAPHVDGLNPTSSPLRTE